MRRRVVLAWGLAAVIWGICSMLWGAYTLSNDFLLTGALALVCGLSVLVLYPMN